MRSTVAWLMTLTVAAGAAVVSARGSVPPSWLTPIEHVPVPARGESGQPQLTTSERGILFSWVERTGPRAALKMSERTAGGWSPARVVASGDDWFVNWADVPSVVRLSDGTLAAHWLQKSGPGTYAYDVRLSHSKDDGRTWSAAVTPHSDGTRTEHGFASLFEMPGKGLALVWLDGRAMKPEAHGAHGGGDAGAMSLRFAAFDRGWVRTSEMALDLRVCECCPTTAATTADGPIVAFRDRTAEEIRDIHVVRLEKGRWTGPKAVSNDGWTVAACPVNGPMLSARDRRVAIAWFTMKQKQGQAFVAFSNDAGRSFGAPIRLDDTGALGRVDVELLPDGSAAASWIEHADARAHFRVRRVEPSGARSEATTVSGIAGTRASGYPRMAWHRGELVFAWTETVEGRPQLQTAAARVSGGLSR